MKNNTKNNILAYIRENNEGTANEIAKKFNLSPQIIFRHLKKMQEDGLVYKIGLPPKVVYRAKQKDQEKPRSKHAEFIDKNYYYISSTGDIMPGEKGFIFWCQKNNLNIEKTAQEYFETLIKYENFKKDGLIDGLPKLKSSFSEVSLEELYYLDFYSIERFGKTKLGNILLYAKQGQNKFLMKEAINLVKVRILEIISKEKIEAVGFIPPTVPRVIQFQKELEKELQLSLPKIILNKKIIDTPIPQKSLNKLSDRIENARATIVYKKDDKFYNKILLIDDALGSGATLNEVAKKIKTEKGAKKIIGLALVGSFKGFDVVNEV